MRSQQSNSILLANSNPLQISSLIFLVVLVTALILLILPTNRAYAGIQHELNAGDAGRGDLFGRSVDIDGDTAIIGTGNDIQSSMTDGGAAYVFTHSNGVWVEEQKLTVENSTLFGHSVAIQGDIAVITDPHASYRACSDSEFFFCGSAYVFTRTNGLWTLEQKLGYGTNRDEEYFGTSVDISDNTIIIGAAGGNGDNCWSESYGCGEANIYTRKANGKWAYLQSLSGSIFNQSEIDESFSVAIKGKTAILGAPYTTGSDYAHRGYAYIFKKAGGEWSEQQILENQESDRFGDSVAVDVNRVAISGTNKVYTYQKKNNAWIEESVLGGKEFGNVSSLALERSNLLVGTEKSKTYPKGAIFWFKQACGVWNQRMTIQVPDDTRNRYFDRTVALSGKNIIVGNPVADVSGRDSGSAYVIPFPATGTDLIVKPANNLCSEGASGALFPTTTKRYVLKNVTEQPLRWRLKNRGKKWLSLSKSGNTWSSAISGILQPGRKLTVRVRVNRNARELTAGTYFLPLDFENRTAGVIAAERYVVLKVFP